MDSDIRRSILRLRDFKLLVDILATITVLVRRLNHAYSTAGCICKAYFHPGQRTAAIMHVHPYTAHGGKIEE